MDSDIKVTFIISKGCVDENSSLNEMQLAYTACEQHQGGGLQPRWLHERDCNDFESLTKKDVFVLEEFEGVLFQKLKDSKCLLIGPRCLSCCLTEGSAIPSGSEPVFTIAMKGVVITTSGLSKLQKVNIIEKVHWMGGTYIPILSDITTHLVSDTVLSDKYIKATANGIPVMAKSWIEDVWQTSLQLNVNGASSQFMNHKLSVFANLEITTSGLAKKEKQEVMKLVNENGGKFSGVFQSQDTDVVVLSKSSINSEKYKAALQYNKICVTTDWVKDSARLGMALPVTQYKVAGASTSSPLASHNLPDMSLNFSRITNIKPASHYVDESRPVDISTLSMRKSSQDTKRQSDSSVVAKEIVSAFENLNLSDTKMAGPIFDGFCIWISGPEGPWRERACACVSRGGGVRYDTFHERVTHAVAANQETARSACQALPLVPILTPMWLVDSVRAKKALPELDYLIEEKTQFEPKSATKKDVEASPMSKRNLQLLRPKSKETTPPPTDHAPEELLQYLSQNGAVQDTTSHRTPKSNKTAPAPDFSDNEGESTEMPEQIFEGLVIEVQDLEEEDLFEVNVDITGAGGITAAPGSGGSHVVVPLDFDVATLANKNAEPVTNFWIKDCQSQHELVRLEYYHRPILIPDGASTILSGVVLTLSTYSGVERAFLDQLAKLLGAHIQLRFCRRTTSNSIASTHLICPAPIGEKYAGAVKWGLPAVTAQWLLDIAKEGEQLSEEPYLVGDTKAPPQKPKLDAVAEIRKDSFVTTRAKHSVVGKHNRENTLLGKNMTDHVLENAPQNEENNTKLDEITDITNESFVTSRAKDSVVDRHNSGNTVLGKNMTADALENDGEEMLPVYQYIAKARQWLLEGEPQEKTGRVNDLKQQAKTNMGGMRTPPLDDALSTPNLMLLSPTSRRRLNAIKRGEMPSGPISTPKDPFNDGIMTPNSDFGAALRPGSNKLSPKSRKRLWAVVQGLPDLEQQHQRHKSTPLSEIRNKFLAQFNSGSPLQAHQPTAPRKLSLQDQTDTPPNKIAKTTERQTISSVVHKENEDNTTSDVCSHVSDAGIEQSSLPSAVNAQLQQLNAALSRLSSPANRTRRQRESISQLQALEPVTCPDSHPNTVGWEWGDKSTPQPGQAVKHFIISSNVDNQAEILEMIIELGGKVSEGTEMDSDVSHMLCAVPGRSEKFLSSIASGRWVLHPTYIHKSKEHGSFLPEEEYEWGNENATCVPTLTSNERALALAAHRWRVARCNGEKAAFAGLKALLHMPAARKILISKLLEAGGGVVHDLESPYRSEDMDKINVCFFDKRYTISHNDVSMLKTHRIPVCTPLILTSFLTEPVAPRPEENCIPEFRFK